MTLNQTIAEYKKRAGVAFFPCNKPGCDCYDYRPNPANKLNKPCQEPWPKCVCKHLAGLHQAEVVKKVK